MAASSWYALTKDGQYSFELLRGSMLPSDGLKDRIADALYEGLIEVGYVKGLLERLGQNAVAEYLDKRGFVGKLSKRVADFGEIIAGNLLSDEEGLKQLIHKLRYRDKATWSMRLTDVFTVAVVNDQIEALCFASVRSGVTSPPITVAASGYQQLVEDYRVEHPEILFFTSEQLYREGRFTEAKLFDRVLSSPRDVRRRFRLLLIFDSKAWHEGALSELDDQLDDDLPEFRAYLLVCDSMRELVDSCYQIATLRCYEQ
jgi:hypothetical protein